VSDQENSLATSSWGDAQPLDEPAPQLADWAATRTKLYKALGQNKIVLYCQPVLDLSAGLHFPMAEVLVRLHEEEEALVPPGDFLPVFEHYRMMPALDRWVVGKVVRQFMQSARIARFSINISTQTLEEPGFPKFVADALPAAALPASSLVFEIDESDMLSRFEPVARFAASIKAIGCGVLIDGFGGRAVSFAPFKRLCVDFLKVDGSIVRNILRSPIAQTKLDAILRVAKTLDVGIIAEAVEEQDIHVRLKALGVGYAQGFGICEPHPIAALLGMPT
jgi:EAL domain-containing protein (putative c-di-GMP-specific phosphodiesterase class I)